MASTTAPTSFATNGSSTTQSVSSSSSHNNSAATMRKTSCSSSDESISNSSSCSSFATTTNSLPTTTSVAAAPSATSGSRIISLAELAKHNTEQDLWVSIRGVVHDMSSYIQQHPGGNDIILSRAGGDATTEFENIEHSDSAKMIAKGLVIGKLNKQDAKFLQRANADDQAGLVIAIVSFIVFVVMSVLAAFWKGWI